MANTKKQIQPDVVSDDQLEIRYVLLQEAVKWLWDDNPKSHDIGAICTVIARDGFNDPPKFEPNLGENGAIIYGNGRLEALDWMRDNNWERPNGIRVDEHGRWLIPVIFGVNAKNKTLAKASAIDHNSLTMMGGGFSVHDISRLYKPDTYLGVLDQLLFEGEMPVSVDAEELRTLHHFAEESVSSASSMIPELDTSANAKAIADDLREQLDRVGVDDRWPMIKCKLRPDLYEIFIDITDDFTSEGHDNDETRLSGLLSTYKNRYRDEIAHVLNEYNEGDEE